METPVAPRGWGRISGFCLHLLPWPMPGAGDAEGWGQAAQRGPKVVPAGAAGRQCRHSPLTTVLTRLIRQKSLSVTIPIFF